MSTWKKLTRKLKKFLGKDEVKQFQRDARKLLDQLGIKQALRSEAFWQIIKNWLSAEGVLSSKAASVVNNLMPVILNCIDDPALSPLALQALLQAKIKDPDTRAKAIAKLKAAGFDAEDAGNMVDVFLERLKAIA